jgi:hypothetical protein
MNTASNQTEQSSASPKPALPTVPTTRILAIGRFIEPRQPDKTREIFLHEVPETVRLYLAGKIDQWWIRKDQNGPVFLLNVTTIQAARSILEELPFGRARLMEFDFLELGPLAPLHVLLYGDNGTPEK